MNQYSHAVLANILIHQIRPRDRDEYIWGALAPDIRYLANMRREHTHRSSTEIASWKEKFPARRSFIQGYHVHCQLDKIDLVRVLTRRFPLRLVRPMLVKRLRPRQAAVALELYFQQSYPEGIALQGGHNEVIDLLGITPQHSEEFAAALAGYLREPSYDSALAAFTRLGILSNGRVEKYAADYRMLQKNKFLMSLLLWSFHRAGLEEIALQIVSV